MTLRDPRNRVLSHINTIYRNEALSIKQTNQLFLQSFTRTYLQQTQKWWDKFSTLEMIDAMDWYLYFYEDIRRDAFSILKEIIWFAGFDAFIDDRLIREILIQTDIDKRREHSGAANSGEICSFHSERRLYAETKRRAT